ncbi:MAG: carbamoyl phosphate synthase large subunit, partial [bacterium]|nr:carbamoyl phosphate synthase large subunit [bacterium]
AARVMAGGTLEELGVTQDSVVSHYGVKEAVFPFKKFPGEDVLLGPEMKSTGEVMGLAPDFPAAFLKSQLGAGSEVPSGGRAFVSVRDEDKAAAVPVAQALVELGFEIVATDGTHRFLDSNGIPARKVHKVTDGERPHIVDLMEQDEIAFVLNTTEGKQSKLDSYSIRRTALLRNIFYCTTLAAAQAATRAMRSLREGKTAVRSLQAYHGSGTGVAERV